MGIKEKRLLLEERLNVAETMRRKVQRELYELQQLCTHENTEIDYQADLFDSLSHRSHTVTRCTDCWKTIKEVWK